jgi:hypothetical protein
VVGTKEDVAVFSSIGGGGGKDEHRSPPPPPSSQEEGAGKANTTKQSTLKIAPGAYPGFLVTKFEVNHEDDAGMGVGVGVGRLRGSEEGRAAAAAAHDGDDTEGGEGTMTQAGVHVYGGFHDLNLYLEGPFRLRKKPLVPPSSIEHVDREEAWGRVQNTFEAECKRQVFVDSILIGLSCVEIGKKKKHKPDVLTLTLILDSTRTRTRLPYLT